MLKLNIINKKKLYQLVKKNLYQLECWLIIFIPKIFKSRTYFILKKFIKFFLFFINKFDDFCYFIIKILIFLLFCLYEIIYKYFKFLLSKIYKKKLNKKSIKVLKFEEKQRKNNTYLFFWKIGIIINIYLVSFLILIIFNIFLDYINNIYIKIEKIYFNYYWYGNGICY